MGAVRAHILKVVLASVVLHGAVFLQGKAPKFGVYVEFAKEADTDALAGYTQLDPEETTQVLEIEETEAPKAKPKLRLPKLQLDSLNEKKALKQEVEHEQKQQDRKQKQQAKRQRAMDRFYTHQNQEIKRLLTEDSLMDWNRLRKQKGKYNRFLEFFPHRVDFPADGNITLREILNVTDSNYFYSAWGSLCHVAKAFDDYRSAQPKLPPLKKHVAIVHPNQDFGAVSSLIKGKTANYKKGMDLWKQEGCSEDDIRAYLDHPDTLGVFTTQFHTWDHPKVTSISLGLSTGSHEELLEQSKILTTDRQQLLMINSMDRGMRTAVTQSLIARFHQKGYNVSNTYNAYANSSCPTPDNPKNCYIREMGQSKFIFSPSGLGLDCYRNWEALYMGTIPVVETLGREKTDGWLKDTLADLPIAFIDDYANLTPEFLEREYERLVIHADPSSYNFEKLTRQYWANKVLKLVEDATTSSGKKRGKKKIS